MRWNDKNVKPKLPPMTPDEDAMYNELRRICPNEHGYKISFTELSTACQSCCLTYQRGLSAMMGLATKGYFAVRRVK